MDEVKKEEQFPFAPREHIDYGYVAIPEAPLILSKKAADAVREILTSRPTEKSVTAGFNQVAETLQRHGLGVGISRRLASLFFMDKPKFRQEIQLAFSS